MPRHEAGNAMGIVSLGAGLFGFFGPQMLGILRDVTGAFTAGFYMVDVRRSDHVVPRRSSLPDDTEFDNDPPQASFRPASARTLRRCACWYWCAGSMPSRAGTRRLPSGTRATGDQQRELRVRAHRPADAVPPLCAESWNGKDSLPILLFLHGAGANERTYLDMADGQMMKLAEQHGYIIVSPLGFTAMGAYGNPLRLPAVYGQSDVAAQQRAAVTPGAPA